MVPVFIFSLPRSGSTLLQRILATHDDIETASEPWLLLPIFYAFRKSGIYTEYMQSNQSLAIDDFCATLPHGKKDFFREVHDFVLALYEKSAGKEVKYFVDKTPRYHLIVEEVMTAFPEAKFIFLWRHPLAIIASLIETWGSGRWNIYDYNIDLYDGLDCLASAYEKHREQVISVNYEKLLHNQQEQCCQIFDQLGLEFSPEQLIKLKCVKLKGKMGDKFGENNYYNLSSEPLTKWKKTLANPIRKKWCKNYLKWIGPERLQLMGYDLDELLHELSAISSAPIKSIYQTPIDLLKMAVGVIYCLSEPFIMIKKIKLLRHLHRLHQHR